MNAHDRIIRRLLDALDDPWIWAYIGVATLMIAWVILTAHFGTFTGGPFP